MLVYSLKREEINLLSPNTNSRGTLTITSWRGGEVASSSMTRIYGPVGQRLHCQGRQVWWEARFSTKIHHITSSCSASMAMRQGPGMRNKLKSSTILCRAGLAGQWDSLMARTQVQNTERVSLLCSRAPWVFLQGKKLSLLSFQEGPRALCKGPMPPRHGGALIGVGVQKEGTEAIDRIAGEATAVSSARDRQVQVSGGRFAFSPKQLLVQRPLYGNHK